MKDILSTLKYTASHLDSSNVKGPTVIVKNDEIYSKFEKNESGVPFKIFRIMDNQFKNGKAHFEF